MDNSAVFPLYELIYRVEGVLGDAIEVAIEIEAQTMDLHKETGPKSTPITALRIITIRALLLKVLGDEDLEDINHPLRTTMMRQHRTNSKYNPLLRPLLPLPFLFFYVDFSSYHSLFSFVALGNQLRSILMSVLEEAANLSRMQNLMQFPENKLPPI